MRDRRWPAVILLSLVAAGRLCAMHPTHPVGYSPEKAYQLGQVDSIDLFSGALGVNLPVGPFTLSYSSSAWVYEEVLVDGQVRIKAEPNRRTSAGLGWHLGWGEVYSPVNVQNESGRWMFIGSDGAPHLFYDTLHRFEDDGDAAVFYTRDNSYLRLIKHNNYYVDVEFPDGATWRLDSGTGGQGATYRLKKVWNRFGSAANPDLQVTYNADRTLRTVRDRYGRTHYIRLRNDLPYFTVVTQVDLESSGGERALYDFTYQVVRVSRSCKDDYYSGTADRISLPLLVKVALPDGTAYSMREGGQHHYYTLCENAIDDLPGILKKIHLPTGGSIEWDFQKYRFPPGPDFSVFNTSAGVKDRRLVAADGTVAGTWTYKTLSFAAQEGVDPEVRTEVVYPTGDCSRHFFDAIYSQNARAQRGWELGLPFVYRVSSGGRYLSSEVWSSHYNRGCAGTRLRTTYLKFSRDRTPGPSATPLVWYHTNRRLAARRVVFHDDGNRWVDTAFSDFDGLGHYRRVKTTGSFWSGSTTGEERTVFTDFNPSRGTYPGSFTPPVRSDPWVLNLFDYRTVSEPDAVGEGAAKVEYGFEAATGFLSCTRVLKSGTARGPNDVLTTFTRNARGEVTDVRRYGGDLQTLSAAGAGCGAAPAQPDAWTRHTYEVGALKTSRPLKPDGTPGPFLTYDVDLDPSTGQVTASRAPSGLVTLFDYDAAGRLESVRPTGLAESRYSFVNPAAGEPARVLSQRLDGASVLTESELVFDDFGRVAKTRRKMPGGGWSEQETRYNARGWITSVSELGYPSRTTQFLEHDPFGRPQTIRPPDGAGHDVRVTYSGSRRIVQSSKIALAGGEAYVDARREWDRYGRLRRVEEPSWPSGAYFATTYSYDVGNRLTGVVAGGTALQRRSFEYDNRGFLLSETHPEKGVGGNGTVSYLDYDTGGRAHRKIDGPDHLGYQYDFMGRLTHVRDRNAGNRLLTYRRYDGASGYGAGRLWYTSQHNYLDLPWTAGGEEDVIVQQTYAYNSASGAPRWRRTKVLFPSQPAERFLHMFLYDSLDNVRQRVYPRCEHATCAATEPASLVLAPTYDEGLASEVPGWAGPIVYHPNGAWAEIPHANGVTDHQQLDANVPSRPYRLYTTGASRNWNSTVMHYDGSGNLKLLGSGATFTYDPVNRITAADYGSRSQSFSYDVVGNLTSVTTTEPNASPETVTLAVDPGTNRLSAAAYDGAGNLTAWGPNTLDYYPGGRRKSLSGRWLYLYDADGERAATIDWTGAVSTRKITYTLRDLSHQVLSRFVLIGEDAVGNWALEREYVRLGGRLVASTGGEGIRHYHLDHLGSLRMATDGIGTRLYTRSYYPYGREMWGAGGEPLKFTGHERDYNVGGTPDDFDYMHARYYSPHLGRFLTVDPAPLRPGEPQSHNRFTYVVSSPLRFVDPEGRDPQDTNKVLDEYGKRTKSEYHEAWEFIGNVSQLGPAPPIMQLISAGLFIKDVYDTFIAEKVSPPANTKIVTETVVIPDTSKLTHYDSIDVVDKMPDIVIDDAVFVEVRWFCNNWSCFEIELSASSERELEREFNRIQREIDTMWSLNSLIDGACYIYGEAVCARGGFGTSFSTYWMAAYLF